jgi:uncharacterized delta-60 repeat protein
MTISWRTSWRPVAGTVTVGLVLWQFGVAAPAYAQDKHLDPAFGTGGKVRTNVGGTDVVNALAVQGTKIVAAGVTGTDRDNFAVARYNANGTLDTTFGTGGVVVTDFGPGDVANAVLIQGTKIVVAGSTQTGGPDEDFALARYNTNGTLDTTFGTGGKVITAFDDFAGANALTMVGGKLIAVGTMAGQFAVAAYTSSGALDTPFSGDGKATFGFGGPYDEARAVLPMTDHFVVGGYATGFQDADFATVEFDLTGTPVPGSMVTNDFGADDVIESLTLQGGKVVAAGYSARAQTQQDFAVARYNADRSLDKTFGTGGLVRTDFAMAADHAYAVVPDRTGLLVAGSSVTSGRSYFGLVRYTSTGARDTTFGTNGRATTGFAGSSRAFALVAHGNGFVAGGEIGTTAGEDFGLARYVLP